MRNGKDQTYRLPILVLAANEYLKFLGQVDWRLNDNILEIAGTTFYTDETVADIHHVPVVKKFRTSRDTDLKIDMLPSIPRSSYYRVMNQLVKEGFMIKLYIDSKLVPQFFITLKGFALLTGTITNPRHF